jgi:hypothetical protein
MAKLGPKALETFGHLAAGLTGHAVEIRIEGETAYTDGRTIVLPGRGVWNPEEFRALCGHATHELAHVWFNSNAELVKFLRRYPAQKAGLARACFNTVVDVADETRIERAFPGAAVLLAESSTSSLKQALVQGAITSSPPDDPTAWQILAAAIWTVRSDKESFAPFVFERWPDNVPGLKAVIRLLKRVIDLGKGPLTTPQRKDRQWTRLLGIAAQILSELVSHYPPERWPDDDRGDGTDMAGFWRRAACDSAVAHGLATRSVSAVSVDWQDALNPPIADDAEPQLIPFDEAIYEAILPAFRRTCRRVPAGEQRHLVHGQLSGRLTRPYRAGIDGRIFARSSVEAGDEAAVALVFDHSMSMAGLLGAFLPVGLALGQSMREAGMTVAAWRFGDISERVELPDLRRSSLLGSTATHQALDQAHDWLSGRPENRRFAVVFTDGQPDEPDLAIEATARLKRAGIRLIFGTIGEQAAQCSRLAPWSIIFDVAPAHAAASLQMVLKRIIRD